MLNYDGHKVMGRQIKVKVKEDYRENRRSQSPDSREKRPLQKDYRDHRRKSPDPERDYDRDWHR